MACNQCENDLETSPQMTRCEKHQLKLQNKIKQLESKLEKVELLLGEIRVVKYETQFDINKVIDEYFKNK